MTRCPHCPVRADSPRACLGAIHPPACRDVARGLAGRAEQLVALAEGLPPATAPGRVDARLAMLADLCPHGSGACGCGPEPRNCSRPDRPGKVWRRDCISCQAESSGAPE